MVGLVRWWVREFVVVRFRVLRKRVFPMLMMLLLLRFSMLCRRVLSMRYRRVLRRRRMLLLLLHFTMPQL
jgi:hypothetical protein